MITRVDTVLIGKNCPASYTTVDALNVGDVALFDENKALIASADDAKAADCLYIGVAKSKVKVAMPDGTVAEKETLWHDSIYAKIESIPPMLYK